MAETDQAKTKARLIADLEALRSRVAETERLAAESAEAAGQLGHFYQQSLDLMAVLDFQGRYVRVNAAYERILGYTAAELIGRRQIDLVHPLDRAESEECLARLAAGEPIGDHVVRKLHKDGSVRWIARSMVLVPERQAIFVIGRNITEQYLAEESARQSELWYRELVENLSEVIYFLDAEGIIRYVNPAVELLAGYTPKELIGQPVTSFFHPEDRQRVLGNLQRLLAGEPTANDYRLLTKAGDIRWVRTSSRPAVRQGRIVGVQGVLTDVTTLHQAHAHLQQSHEDLQRRVEHRTAELVGSVRRLQGEVAERRRAEQAMREGESLLRTMLENMPLDFWACDTDCRCVMQSNESIENWGDVRGKRLADEADDQRICRHWEAQCRQALEGKTGRSEIVATTRDGQQRHFVNIVAPIVLEQKVCGVLGINVDLTEQKQHERSILDEQQRLQRLLEFQEHQRKLIAYEIHDGFVQEATGALLFLEGLPEDVDLQINHARQRLGVAVEALRRGIAEARQLINGLRPPRLEELGPIAALEHHLGQLQQGTDVQIDFDHRVQFTRLTTVLETAIFRIVQEAVNNALRHSGSPAVQVSLTEEDGWLLIEVTDQGVGFDPKQTLPKHYGLEGIRHRARLLGGHAQIHSAPGQGTRVAVRLPLNKTEQPPGKIN